MAISMDGVTIAVCGAKVHAVRKAMDPLPELAMHVLGFAIGDVRHPGARPGMFPYMCQKCRAPSQVDQDDIWVRSRWGICYREQRVHREQRLARQQARMESLRRRARVFDSRVFESRGRSRSPGATQP